MAICYSNNSKLIYAGNKLKGTKDLLLKNEQILTKHENNVVSFRFYLPHPVYP